MIDYFESRGARVIVLSEYRLVDVSKPVHLNRMLREQGLLAVREEVGGELLDAGASTAFAVADHQVAHVYVNDARQATKVRALLEKIPGVERVLDKPGKRPSTLRTIAAVSSSSSPNPMRGSPTTTGSTIGARRTSRGPSTSTASRAMTRLSW